MDLLCPKCGEPWDFETIHDVVAELIGSGDPDDCKATFQSVAADFRRRGCPALDGRCSTGAEADVEGAVAASTLYELLGDDMDGAAAMLEDMGW